MPILMTLAMRWPRWCASGRRGMRSAASRKRSSSARTASEIARPQGGSAMSAPRSAMCSTARFSVALTGRPSRCFLPARARALRRRGRAGRRALGRDLLSAGVQAQAGGLCLQAGGARVGRLGQQLAQVRQGCGEGLQALPGGALLGRGESCLGM